MNGDQVWAEDIAVRILDGEGIAGDLGQLPAVTVELIREAIVEQILAAYTAGKECAQEDEPVATVDPLYAPFLPDAEFWKLSASTIRARLSAIEKRGYERGRNAASRDLCAECEDMAKSMDAIYAARAEGFHAGIEAAASGVMVCGDDDGPMIEAADSPELASLIVDAVNAAAGVGDGS